MNSERCETHGCELSQCGDMTEDGPEVDCRECQLEATIAELRQWEQLARDFAISLESTEDLALMRKLDELDAAREAGE